MKKNITHVGLDAHSSSIFVAMQVAGREAPVQWKTSNDRAAIKKLVKKLEKAVSGEIQCWYEAGPTGYAVKRQIEEVSRRVKCTVVAPSLIPRKPGDRIKTDRRDARKLCELGSAGLLTEVHAPNPGDEAVRDLLRARDDARVDLMRARHRLSKFLLRRGHRYLQGKAWTQRHLTWLKTLEWEHEADRFVFADYMQAVELVQARLKALDAKIGEFASQEPYATAVGRLRCFRGIDTLTAMIIVVELYDFRRFHSPRSLTAYLGMVPGERSSAERVNRQGITKTGNRVVRRALVEAAWHYRHRPDTGAGLKKRREGQPPDVVAIAAKSQIRLNRRFHALLNRNKPASVVAMAVARELACFIWAALFPFEERAAV